MTARYLAAILMTIVAAAGCGKTGRPLPPLPRGPLPPADVTVRQVGETVRVRYTVPERRGERPSQALVGAELWRVGWDAGVEPASDPGLFARRGEVVATDADGGWSAGARRAIDDRTAVSGSAGGTLRYAIRLRDRAGRSSALVLADDLRPLPSRPAPLAPAAESTSRGVRLTWKAVDDVAATYNVYRRTADGPGSEVPLNDLPLEGTEFEDVTVETGTRYLYTVRSVLDEGLPRREGRTSEQVDVVATDLFPPAAPTGLVVVQEGAAVKLFWNPNDESDLGGYRVYRRLSGGEWSSVAAEVTQPNWLDPSVGLGSSAAYRVTAIDSASPPNESGPSTAVDILLLTEPSTPGGGSPR